MKKIKDLNRECDYFSAFRLDKIAWIVLKGNMLQQSTDLRCRDTLLNYLNLVSEDKEIKIVAIFNSKESAGYEKYAEFYQMVGDSKIDENDVWRMFRTFDSLIKTILESPKFFISAAKGKLCPQILNLSLACDYRIISEDTTIQNQYLEFGLAPKGGGAYFLKKRLGHCKAFELLLSEEEITANDALELGLVNKVVPPHSLKECTLERAQAFAKKPSDSLTAIKRLLNFADQDFVDYLELENHELMHVLRFAAGNSRIERSERRV
ncbi:MAG: enoyl-CoA hydratase/isomerase family protein [Nitrospinales bacterium]